MPKFMLLIYNDGTGFQNLSPEEMQKATEKFMAWTNRPTTLDGNRLAGDVGRVLRSENGKPRVKDGPYSETKEVLGGYFTIEAANYDEAVQLALTNPSLEYGGTIEVRQVFGT
jgi:hypothetical protein